MIPAGGMRMPSTAATAAMEDVGDHNLRAKDHLRMDGSAVFNFVQTEVPPMIDDLLAAAGMPMDAVDWFLFHQPNRFMLQKLAEKMRVSPAKMPSNIVERFGNSSGVTIPMAIVDEPERAPEGRALFGVPGRIRRGSNLGIHAAFAGSAALLRIERLSQQSTMQSMSNDTMDDIYSKLAQILEVERVNTADVLSEFEYWDSLTVLSILAMLDSAYGVNLTSAEFGK